jgi:hypothetical protein
MDESNRICPWCSTPIPAGAAACPKCGALAEGSVAQEIPGLTVVDPRETRGPDAGPVPDGIDAKARLLFGDAGVAADPEAFQPPSEAVRREMRKIELEAEIENAGSVVMSPTGDESRLAGAPSPEAIEAHEAGLLDKTGPAGEPDLGDLATPWEKPELK